MKAHLYSLMLLICLTTFSCGSDYSPKPRGYFRIQFPAKSYNTFSSNCPFTFDYPVYSKVQPDSSRQSQPCWYDVAFPEFNGRIHLSYQKIGNGATFNELTEDARTFAFKHTVKATAIDEASISFPEKKVFGTYYAIDGNTASSVQFFLTDSSKHYVRGALYFYEQPRLDSIQPVLDFLKKDIDVMIRSFKWKN